MASLIALSPHRARGPGLGASSCGQLVSAVSPRTIVEDQCVQLFLLRGVGGTGADVRLARHVRAAYSDAAF